MGVVILELEVINFHLSIVAKLIITKFEMIYYLFLDQSVAKYLQYLLFFFNK